MRTALVALIAVPGFLLGLEASESDPVLVVCELVGVEFDGRRLFVYATPESATCTTELYLDDWRAMAEAAYTIGSFGFSLELDRRAGRSFGPDDVTRPGPLAAELQRDAEGASPLVAYLKTRLSPHTQVLLREYAVSMQPLEVLDGLRVALAEELNRLTQDPILRAQVDTSVVSPEVRWILGGQAPPSLTRANRLIIEDALAEFVESDLGPDYVIRYLTRNVGAAHRLFNGRRAEHTFSRADKAMKDLGRCDPRFDGAKLGPCPLHSAARELLYGAERGRRPRLGTHVTYFDLEVQPDFDGVERVWLRNARLIVRAGVRDPGDTAPSWVQAFARNLTAAIPRLATHVDLGNEIRRVKALMVMGRVFGYTRSIGVPANSDRLASCRVLVEADPPDLSLRRDHLIVSSGGNPLASTSQLLVGGVAITSAGGVASFWPRPTPAVRHGGPRVPRGADCTATLGAESAYLNGQEFLRIDLSELLGIGG